MTAPDGPRHDCVLVRYGELALKSRRVRSRFEARLREAVVEAFAADGLDCVVEHDGGHVYVYSSDLAAATDRARRIFGVVSVSPAQRAGTAGMQELADAVAGYSLHVLSPGGSFAVRARRTGTHPFTSMDLAKAAGAAVLRAFEDGVTVDLEEPDVELEVEVRGGVAYLYHQRLPGVGGLPPGSQGRVLCPLREVPDAVACWMLMRRGCQAVVLVPEGGEGTTGLEGALRRWDPTLSPRTLPAEDWEWPALYREMGRTRSMAVVSGARGPEVPPLPPDRGESPMVFHPLVGLDDEAYARLEAVVMSGELDAVGAHLLNR